MSKVTGFLLFGAVLVLTAVSVYQYATIQHLQFVVRLLAGGVAN